MSVISQTSKKCDCNLGTRLAALIAESKQFMRDSLIALAIAGALTITPLTLSAQADNTKVNKRDRAKTEATADQAKNSKPDLEMAQKIRKSLMDDKALSTMVTM